MGSPSAQPRRTRWRPGSWLWAFVGLLVTLELLVNASSPPPRPLRRIHHPSSLSLHILPRSSPLPLHRRILHPPSHTLLSIDALRLSLRLPSLTQSEQEIVYLHLRPNEELFHPEAQITLTDETGQERTEKLLKEEWRVYHGDVVVGGVDSQVRLKEDEAGVLPEYRDASIERGKARIMVHNDGLGQGEDNRLSFEGSFEIDGQTYHILTRENFLRHRVDLDPEIDDEVVGWDNGLVVFLEGDQLPSSSTKSDGGSLCSHDALDWNQNLSHPIRGGPGSVFGADKPITLKAEDGYRHYSPKGAGAKLDPFGAFSPDLRDFKLGEWDGGSGWLRKRDDISTGSGSGVSGNYVGSIGSTAGCPTQTMVVYMGVAADCTYVTTYGSAEAAKTQIINNMNQASSLYKSTFNVGLGITQLTVVDSTCPSQAAASTPWNIGCSSSISLNQRLSLFSSWRGTTNRQSTAGLWHLMTACPTDTEVGVAWLGTLCQTTSQTQGSSTVSGTGVSTATKVEWSLIAHEVGHNFGAVHDCTSGCSLPGTVSGASCCPLSASTCNAGSQFIMNPTTNVQEVAFSPCTIGNICSGLGSKSVNSQCLQIPGAQTTVTLQQCGNGIVEAGEDCDPGLNVTSPCCNSATCKFNTGAVCDPLSSTCCTQSCGFASNSTVCRPAVNAACDVPETCTGTSSACPSDKTAADGTSCGNGLSCASGQCTSLDQQCATAGASLRLTTSCSMKNDRTCMVSCQNPNSPGSCLVLQSPLIDGSPCGYGGHCYNSTCQAGSLGDTVNAWYTQNLQYSIPATIGVSLVALAILYAFIRCIFCRGRTRSGRAKQYLPAPTPIMAAAPGAAPTVTRSPPRTLQRQQRRSYDPNAPYDPSQANSMGDNSFRPPPPPQRTSVASGFGQPAFPPGQAPMPFQPAGSYNPYTQPHYQQPPSHDGWVDARAYNGPNWRP